jgi:hypothetical protein
MDNRKYTRLPIDVMVELRLGEAPPHYGETADVSIDGAFITLTPPSGLQHGQACQLDLIIKTDEGWVRVAFHGSVAHIREDGLGVQFATADINHHETFLKLLINGTSDVDRLLEELGNHPRSADFRFRQD